jgi:tRNA threonylcarbamoyladenosine biosynthesis protein TsaB
MALILGIETATHICSVSLSGSGRLLACEESSAKNSHSSVITLLIEKVLSSAGKKLNDIDAVAVGEGPGSYTGLRIGVATAKGLCYALEKPVIAVGTLKAMAAGMKEAFLERGKTLTGKPVLFIPMIDARRMEVYNAVYDGDGKEIRPPSAEIIDENSFNGFLAHHILVFAGDGAPKCNPLLEHNPGVVFLEEFNASARFMANLAEEKFNAGQFADLVYFEPFYLKDFVAGKPKVKGLE